MLRKSFGYITLILIILSITCSCNQNNSNSPRIAERKVKDNVTLEGEAVGGLKESELHNRLKKYETKLNIEKKDAALTEDSWEIAGKEKPGKRVNNEKIIEALLEAGEGSRVKLVVEEVRPQVTVEKLLENIVEIAVYSTPILDRQDARVKNIDIASRKLDYKKIMPGNEFSFNSAIGRRTEDKGYEYAPIILKTKDGYKKGYGIGGGVCQLATTLYNAVEKSGLQITERHMHTKDVGYVPIGKDATVSYGSVDFKFRNNRPYPLMIRTYMNNKNLTVKIFENRN